jgi:hypothetical protein
MNDQRNFKTLTDAVDMPPVSGSTDVYLILGDPVEQVLAPETFNPTVCALWLRRSAGAGAGVA